MRMETLEAGIQVLQSAVVSLPMRDGNPTLPSVTNGAGDVVSLPMRDGNVEA